MKTKTEKVTQTSANETSKTICKIGLDVHAASIMVVQQIDGMNPKPPQRFSPQAFLDWIQEQVKKGFKIISCYEAGPTGYWLHRKLTEYGVTNYVVCPTRLDSRAKGVNTDKTDAIELLVRLDRYVAGNKKAFSVVSVPTLEQEQKRALTRQREQLKRQRLSLSAQGRMLLLTQGYRVSNFWWDAQKWIKIKCLISDWLLMQLECILRLIQAVDKEIDYLTAQVIEKAPSNLPLNMGKLTYEVIEGEVKDWNNFKNRRQIASYSGLTGGVSGSGERSSDLSITKSGNRRLSSCLVECSWRIVFRQSNYWLVKKWKHVLLNPKAHVRRRKRAIVAFARQFLVDLWRWKTGKTTPENLGWVMS
jgi:transposase